MTQGAVAAVPPDVGPLGRAGAVDLVVRRARLWPGSAGPVDVAVVADRIASVGVDLAVVGREVDAAGRVLVPGLVETHLHLDKSRLPDVDTDGGLEAAIARTAEAKASFTPDAVHRRAVRTLESCLVHGTTRVRTHVEVDPTVGLRGFEGVMAARESFAGRVDVQVCVFPQEGLAVEAATAGLLATALGAGATVIGGAPYTDSDPRAQIDMVFDLARDHDVDVDLHLDLRETTEAMQIEYVCRKVEEAGLHGRVAVGHVTQLSLVPPAEFERIAAVVAAAGVSVTTLPATDLFLMGREATHAKPRGVVPLEVLRRHGVRCSISTNNVLNSFTPFGDGSLVRMANLYANVAHVADPAGLLDCLSMITDQAAGILGCDDYGFEVGAPADMVLLDATDPAAVVAELAPALWGVKGGVPTFTRPDVVLHREARSTT